MPCRYRRRGIYTCPNLVFDQDCVLACVCLALLQKKAERRRSNFRNLRAFRQPALCRSLADNVRALANHFPRQDFNRPTRPDFYPTLQSYLSRLSHPLQLCVYVASGSANLHHAVRLFHGATVRPVTSRVYLILFRQHCYLATNPSSVFASRLCDGCNQIISRRGKEEHTCTPVSNPRRTKGRCCPKCGTYCFNDKDPFFRFCQVGSLKHLASGNLARVYRSAKRDSIGTHASHPPTQGKYPRGEEREKTKAKKSGNWVVAFSDVRKCKPAACVRG